MLVLVSIHVNTVSYVLSERKQLRKYIVHMCNGSVHQVLKWQQPNIPAAKLWDNIKNIYMAVFPHSIDVKIVASENAEWLVTLENH